MLSFNYLPETPRLQDAFTRLFVPRALQLPLRLLAALTIFSVLLVIYENSRLRQARLDEQIAAREYAAQTAPMRDAKSYERRVRSLMELDAEVRRAAKSGTLAAGKLAAISRDLPQDTWLTAITPDSTGLSLDGIAVNLNGIARTLVSLSRDPQAGQPELLRTELGQSTEASFVHFIVHLSVAAN